MTAAVFQLPRAVSAAAECTDLNLTPQEVQDAAGGYKRPADQLRILHERGFTRAYIPAIGKKRVVLERAHYDAVVRGQFGHQTAAQKEERPTPRANRAALGKLFQQGSRK